MKFIADVNITQTVIRFLRNQSHNVLDIKRQNPMAKDTEIIKIASEEKRIVLTHDKDFLALTKYPKYQVAVVLIRLQKQDPKHFCDKIAELLNNKPAELLENSITILTEESAESYPFEI